MISGPTSFQKITLLLKRKKKKKNLKLKTIPVKIWEQLLPSIGELRVLSIQSDIKVAVEVATLSLLLLQLKLLTRSRLVHCPDFLSSSSSTALVATAMPAAVEAL